MMINHNTRKYHASAKRLMVHLLEARKNYDEFIFDSPTGKGQLTFAFALIPEDKDE